MKIVDHWLQGARVCPSAFFNERPQAEISLLVIHCIALPPRIYGGDAIERLFTGSLPAESHPYFAQISGLRVSAHLLIRRTGELVQFVGFDQRAWHAGASSFQGRDNCNDFAIGVELEGSDDQPYTQLQYRQLVKVTRLLQQAYPAITQERICSHAAIAPGRKTDPGSGFDWDFYWEELNG